MNRILERGDDVGEAAGVSDVGADAGAWPIARFMSHIGPSGTCGGECPMPDPAEMREAAIYCSIMVLNAVIERSGNRLLESHGLTLPQWLALGAVLGAGEEGLSHSTLSQRLMLSKAPVTGLVDRLARSGLVERRPDLSDRRVSRVVITSEGEAVWQRAHHTLSNSPKNSSAELSAQQQDELLRLLSRLLLSFASEDPLVAELLSEPESQNES